MNKPRSKYVLEGAITELIKNEYDRYLAIDEMAVNIDSQQYVGGVTADEAVQCKDVLARVQELKDNEIKLLQTLSRNIFVMERTVNVDGDKKVNPDGTVSVLDKEGNVVATTEPEMENISIDEYIEDLNKEKAMKGVDVMKEVEAEVMSEILEGNAAAKPDVNE